MDQNHCFSWATQTTTDDTERTEIQGVLTTRFFFKIGILLKISFQNRNFAENQFYKIGILLKISLLKSELSRKSVFQNRNLAKNLFFKIGILLKISFSKAEFSQKLVFQNRNFGNNVKTPSNVDCKRH